MHVNIAFDRAFPFTCLLQLHEASLTTEWINGKLNDLVHDVGHKSHLFTSYLVHFHRECCAI